LDVFFLPKRTRINGIDGQSSKNDDRLADLEEIPVQLAKLKEALTLFL
jgi:hypothetical protein